jgi:ABC-type sulfate/molybdate transport systems ATPase subunit
VALELDIAVALRAYRLSAALEVARETVALVGPSGSGKTTVLRSIAGLRRPDAGRVALDGRAWFDSGERIDLSPERRSVGLVFQDHALFPHLTVRENVAFGGVARADELLERMRIATLACERPASLSGGERQRVALARALARDPAVLLLDEPFSALDASTRAIVRGELQELLVQLSLPVLLVTHDFRDAAALADRIGVLVDGRILQVGTPAELVDVPADAFVAAFTGSNLLLGEARPAPVGCEIRLDSGDAVRAGTHAAGRVGVAVHPWDIVLLAEAPLNGANAIPGTVLAVVPDGDRLRVRVGEIVAEVERRSPHAAAPARGDRVWATFAAERARIVPIGPPPAAPEHD